MEALKMKRTRLRHELQQAYDSWIFVSERQVRQVTCASCVDVSGSSDATREQWLDYQTAKERLVLAYAEQPLAT
jgi:hypothetical protein